MTCDEARSESDPKPEFKWDGKTVRAEGRKVVFLAENGDEHSWPQHDEFEARRLVAFLSGKPV